MGGNFVMEETVTNSDAKERTGEPKGILSPNLTTGQKITMQSPITGHLDRQPVPPPEPQTGLVKPAIRQVHQTDLKEHRKDKANLLSLNKEI